MRFSGYGSGSREGYEGSSFSELLQIEYPHLAFDLARYGNLERLSVPHGTTVLAFKYADGVIVAGDRTHGTIMHLPTTLRSVNQVFLNVK